MRISKTKLRKIIREELEESIGTSKMRMRSAQEIATSLVHLEKVLKHLLAQKETSEPGSVAHDKAAEQIAKIAAIAQEYAYRSER